MKNWKKINEELPLGLLTVIFMTVEKKMYLGYYLSQTKKWFIENTFNEVSFDEINSDDVIAWCYIPDYDLND